MQDIKFSVLIISHNQEKYIKETVESVLKQGYQNFEVVVSDDCSTDKTQDVVKAIEDERVKLVTIPFNVGINGNEETGIRACTGDYIVLLGGDDRLRSDFIKAKEHYNFTFKEFCNLVNKVDCKQITKFNKKAKKYKKLFITTLISSSILILILLTNLVIQVLG